VLTDTPIGQLFLAGIVPAAIMGVLFAFYLIVIARPRVRRTVRPAIDYRGVTLRARRGAGGVDADHARCDGVIFQPMYVARTDTATISGFITGLSASHLIIMTAMLLA